MWPFKINRYKAYADMHGHGQLDEGSRAWGRARVGWGTHFVSRSTCNTLPAYSISFSERSTQCVNNMYRSASLRRFLANLACSRVHAAILSFISSAYASEGLADTALRSNCTGEHGGSALMSRDRVKELRLSTTSVYLLLRGMLLFGDVGKAGGLRPKGRGSAG